MVKPRNSLNESVFPGIRKVQFTPVSAKAKLQSTVEKIFFLPAN